MSLTVTAIVVLSATLHPLWNTLLKGDEDKAGSWCLFGILLAVCAGTHSLVSGADFGAVRDILPILALSTAGQLLYGLTIIRIYDRGDLSAYYPIIRASPIGVVIIGALFLGAEYGIWVVAGILMTVAGAFWLQKRPGTRLLDDPTTLALAVIGMTGTAIYSIADSRAMRHVEPQVYFFWIEFVLAFVYVPMMALTGHGNAVRRGLNLFIRRPIRHIGAAVIGYASYTLILIAYGSGGDVAAVTTVRQLSIPISVLLAGVVLSEQHIRRRLAASCLLAAGIVMVVLTS